MSLKIGDGDVILDQDGNPILGIPKEGQKGFFENQECVYHSGWGWMTLDELSELRAKEPRMAP